VFRPAARESQVQEIEVQVENDHIERLTSAKPLVALCELIWNSYDADAAKVRVEFYEGDLTKLALIRVSDDGDGIAFDQAQGFFQSLGGSWKKKGMRTGGGRYIHGERGQGRFKAFALGENVTWISCAGGGQFSITGHSTNLKKFIVSDLTKATSRGCIVEIAEVLKDFEIRAPDGFADQIRDVFALQLYEDPSFQIIYDGEQVDAREAIRGVIPCDVHAILPDGREISGKLEIVEWKKKVERKLMLCLPGRFSFHSMAPGIQARGFDFTAYLTADHFQKMADENTEGLVELDPSATALIDAAKSKLREHFRHKEAERSRGKIQEWKDANIYPYEGVITDPIDRNERQVFDVVALNLSDYSPDFDKAPPKQQKLILQLVKAAIETGSSTLPAILEKVIDLPKTKQDELADLLRKTSLTAVINAAKAVTDRLDFLKALQILIFNPKSKKELLERSQLHRIVAQETWIFGERFNLMNDDEDLTAVLRSHLKLLGADRFALAPSGPAFDADGIRIKFCIIILNEAARAANHVERPFLIALTTYSSMPAAQASGPIPKFSSAIEQEILSKMTGPSLQQIAVTNTPSIVVHRIVRYFVKALNFVPFFIDAHGSRGKSDDYKEFRFDPEHRDAATAILNSNLFYWFWRSHSDGFHCGYNDVYSMPYRKIMDAGRRKLLGRLLQRLMKQLVDISEKRSIKTKAGQIRYQEFYPAKSKAIIDEIDCALAPHFSFTAEELDFVINYDIKYRLGRGTDSDEEDE